MQPSGQPVGGRRAVINRILDAITGTPWAEHLVLHGSVAMAAWFGDAAREPRDIDFVVTPDTVIPTSPTADRILADLKTALGRVEGVDPGREIDVNTLWGYERADGRRLVVPFVTPDLPGGRVQVDFIFGDRLGYPTGELVVPGVVRPVRAVPPEQALAWKLMWLVTEPYAEGKDLYDATLLAERTGVELATVRALIRPKLRRRAATFTAESVLALKVNWYEFVEAYPEVGGSAGYWLKRLVAALDRTWRPR